MPFGPLFEMFRIAAAALWLAASLGAPAIDDSDLALSRREVAVVDNGYFDLASVGEPTLRVPEFSR